MYRVCCRHSAEYIKFCEEIGAPWRREVLLKPMTVPAIECLLQREIPKGASDMTEETLGIIAHVSQGNPFFLSRIIKFIKESNIENVNSVAVGIRDNSLIIFMLERVSEKQRMILKAASVLGGTFELDLLEAIVPSAISSLVNSACHSLARKGLLVSLSPGIFRFSSPLVRKFVRDLVPQRYFFILSLYGLLAVINVVCLYS